MPMHARLRVDKEEEVSIWTARVAVACGERWTGGCGVERTPCCLAVGLDEGGPDDPRALEHDSGDDPW